MNAKKENKEAPETCLVSNSLLGQQLKNVIMTSKPIKY